MTNLSTIVLERRLQLGLSQRQVAKKSGCCPRTVRAIEKNERGIGFDYVVSILKALGLRLKVEEMK